MNKFENNVEMYATVSNKLGLNYEYINNSPKKRTLLISNKQKFCIISTGSPGFYPDIKRWNAYLSGNKLLTQKILKELNYNIIDTIAIRMKEFATVHQLVAELNNKTFEFPVLTKPNKGHDGVNIAICENIEQLISTCKSFYENEKDFLIQPYITHNEYRVLVVENELVLIHSKRNQTIIGDGRSTIKILLDAIPESKKSSVVIDWQHKKLNSTMESILLEGEKFEFHITKIPSNDTYYTENFPNEIKFWAEELARKMSSSVLGIDVFIPKEITDLSSYKIIELNSNPAVYYLPKRCDDRITGYKIVERVLTGYFNLK